MTGKGVELSFIADVKPLLAGTDSAAAGLGKVAGALDKVQTEGSAATQALVTDFKTQATAAQQSATAQTRSFELSSREQKRLVREGIKSANEQTKGALSGVAGSFNGNLADLGTSALSATTGIVSALGPIGLAVGTAAAIGIGIFTSEQEKAKKKTEEEKAAVSALVGELIKVGDAGKVGLDVFLTKLQAAATQTDANKDNLEKLKEIADTSGSSFKDLAQAYSGNTDELYKRLSAGEKLLDQLKDQRAAENNANGSDLTAAQAAAREELGRRIVAQQKYNQYLSDAKGIARDAATEAKLYAEAGGPEMEHKIALIKQIDGAYTDAASSTQGFISKESGLLNVDKYLKSFKQREKAIREYQDFIAGSHLSDAAKAYLASLGEDTAAQFAQGYKGASAKQRRELEHIWEQAGKDSSGSYEDALGDGLGKSKVKGPKVELDQPNTSLFKAAMEASFKANKIKVPLEFVDSRNGKKVP